MRTTNKYVVLFICHCLAALSPIAHATEEEIVRYFGGVITTKDQSDMLILLQEQISIVFVNSAITVLMDEEFKEQHAVTTPSIVVPNIDKKLQLKAVIDNGFAFNNAQDESIFMNALLHGDPIFLEVGRTTEELLTAPAGYLYDVAAREYGWKRYSDTASIEPAKIITQRSGDYYMLGAKRYYPAYDQPLLTITASATNQPGIDVELSGVSLTSEDSPVSSRTLLFSFKPEEGGWTIRQSGPLPGKTLLLKDQNGKLLGYWVLPTYRAGREWYQGTLWPDAAQFVRALQIAPSLSTIEVAGLPNSKTIIYGFREMWQWGVDNAGFPDTASQP